MASVAAASASAGAGGGNNGGEMMVLLKVGMFILVQILVYLILVKSSNIFSKSPTLKSFSFKISRASSVARMLAAVSELPSAAEDEASAAASVAAACSYHDQLKEN